MANEISYNVVYDQATHPSINKIKAKHEDKEWNFDFSYTTEETQETVSNFSVKQIQKMGYQQKSSNSVKMFFTTMLINLINLTFKYSVFSDRLKEAQVAPLFQNLTFSLKQPVIVLSSHLLWNALRCFIEDFTVDEDLQLYRRW